MRAQVKVTPIFLSIELDSLEFETHWEREREREIERERTKRTLRNARFSLTRTVPHSLTLSPLSLFLEQRSLSFIARVSSSPRRDRSVDRSIEKENISSHKKRRDEEEGI